MKIINREEFLKMPSGTVFSKYKAYDITQLAIKTNEPEEFSNDFVYCIIGDIESEEMTDSNKKFDILFEMEDKGLSIEMEEWVTMRDGLFDKDQKFVVYEKRDVEKIIEMLQDCIKPKEEK